MKAFICLASFFRRTADISRIVNQVTVRDRVSCEHRNEMTVSRCAVDVSALEVDSMENIGRGAAFITVLSLRQSSIELTDSCYLFC